MSCWHSKKTLLAWASVALLAPFTRLAAAPPAAEYTVVKLPRRVYEAPAERVRHKPPVVTAVALQTNGRLLATAGDDHLVHVWIREDGGLLHRLEGHADWVRTMAFSPDGRVLASAGNDGQIIFWDPERGEQLRLFASRPEAIATITFSNDGRLLAVAGFECKLHVYTVAEGARVLELEGSCGDIRAVAFSPDDKVLAAGGGDGIIRLWDVGDGRLLDEQSAHRQRIRALAFSPSGSLLASSGDDRVVRIAGRGGEHREVVVLPAHPAKVMSLVFYGERQIATGGSDNLIRLWDVATKREIGRLEGHTGSVAALALMKDVLVSGSFDTTVRLWKTPEAAPRGEDPAAHGSGAAQPANQQ